MLRIFHLLYYHIHLQHFMLMNQQKSMDMFMNLQQYLKLVIYMLMDNLF